MPDPTLAPEDREEKRLRRKVREARLAHEEYGGHAEEIEWELAKRELRRHLQARDG